MQDGIPPKKGCVPLTTARGTGHAPLQPRPGTDCLSRHFPESLMHPLLQPSVHLKAQQSFLFQRNESVLSLSNLSALLSALGKMQIILLAMVLLAILPGSSLLNPAPSSPHAQPTGPAALHVTPGGVGCPHQVLSEIHSTTFSQEPPSSLNSS